MKQIWTQEDGTVTMDKRLSIDTPVRHAPIGKKVTREHL